MSELTGLSSADGLAGVLLMQSGTVAMDVFSATNSSPWTAESFGGDPDKTKALWEYVRHAMIISTIYCVGAAYLSRHTANWMFPIVGLVIGTAYMYWLYARAVDRAIARGSKDWS